MKNVDSKNIRCKWTHFDFCIVFTRLYSFYHFKVSFNVFILFKIIKLIMTKLSFKLEWDFKNIFRTKKLPTIWGLLSIMIILYYFCWDNLEYFNFHSWWTVASKVASIRAFNFFLMWGIMISGARAFNLNLLMEVRKEII